MVSEGERVFVQAEFEGIVKLVQLWETRCAWLEGHSDHPEYEARNSATCDVVRELGVRGDAFAHYLAQPVSFLIQSIEWARTTPSPTARAAGGPQL